MTDKDFLPGDIILMKGDISPYFFLIKRGRVKFDNGKETFFLSEEDFFGEEGCFFGKPAPFTSAACEETLIQLMERDEAEQLLNENGSLAFSLFIKNAAKMNDADDPLSAVSPLHIRLVAGILPYVVEENGEKPENAVEIDFETLASQIELSNDKILNLFSFSKELGYTAFEDGQIFSCGRNKLKALLKDYNRKEVFAGISGTKGLGTFSCFDILDNRTNI